MINVDWLFHLATTVLDRVIHPNQTSCSFDFGFGRIVFFTITINKSICIFTTTLLSVEHHAKFYQVELFRGPIHFLASKIN